MSQSCFVGGLIARSRDKFKLCSNMDGSYVQSKGQQLANMICRKQVELVLERFNGSAGIQSFDFKDEVTYFISCDPRTITTIVVANRQAPAFQQSANVQTAMQSSAVQLLDDVQSEFLAMFPPDVVSSATKPFQCIKFDTQFQKCMRRVSTAIMHRSPTTATPSAAHPSQGGLHKTAAASAPEGGQGAAAAGPNNSAATYDTLKRELNDVQNVLRSNLEDILSRGERLETMSVYSAQLKDSSHTYYKRTVSMNRMRMLKMYGPPAAIITLLLIWFWWYFF